MEKKHISITFNELDLVLCNSNTKRKFLKPIYVKTSLHSVGFLYYAGYVLRDASNPKKYYSEEEAREKITNKLEKISITTNEGIVIK